MKWNANSAPRELSCSYAMACVLLYTNKDNKRVFLYNVAWESEDLQPFINSTEYQKYFPKLTPQSLWKIFPAVESPSVWMRNRVPAGSSEYENSRDAGYFHSLVGKRADKFAKE